MHLYLNGDSRKAIFAYSPCLVSSPTQYQAKFSIFEDLGAMHQSYGLQTLSKNKKIGSTEFSFGSPS